MKFLCDGCERLSDVRDFRIDAGLLLVRCDKCHFESKAASPPSLAPRVASVGAAPPPTPFVPKVISLHSATDEAVRRAASDAGADQAFAIPEGRCPKCISVRPPAAAACPQCGLGFDNSAAVRGLEPSGPLAQSWRETLRRWGESGAHDAFLHQAMVGGELPQAGRLYRIRLALHREDPAAQRGVEEVLRLATLNTDAMRDDDAAVGSRPIKPWVAIALVAGLIAVVSFLMSQFLRSLPPTAY